MNRIRKVAVNIISLLTSDLANRGSTFILYALVARYLGAFEFGQLSLGFSFFYMFQIIGVVGLKNLIIRAVAKDKAKTEQYFINSSAIVMISVLFSIIILYLFIRLLNYAPDTTSIILLLSLGLLPASLSLICEAIFEAWEKMHYITYAIIPANIVKVGLAFLLLAGGYSLSYLIIMLFFIRLIILGFQWWLIVGKIIRPRLKIELNFSLALVKSSVTFFGIEGIAIIWTTLSIVLLSKFAGETEVGLYNAAGQLTIPIAMMMRSIMVSVFPIMARKFGAGIQNLNQVSQHLIEVLVSITLPTVVGLYFLADSAFLLVYGGDEFLRASVVLRIMVWGLLFTAYIYVFGYMLLASHQEKVTLRIVIINLIVKLICAFILISQFGLLGAAIAGLISEGVNLIQHYIPVSNLFSKRTIGRLTWKAVIAVTGMALFLAIFQDLGIFLTIVSAGMIYTCILFVLTIWSNGGVYQFKTKYQYIWR